jgi:ElaB/YqjD/DUF883 family membrane-anchored ribosome-binding protein
MSDRDEMGRSAEAKARALGESVRDASSRAARQVEDAKDTVAEQASAVKDRLVRSGGQAYDQARSVVKSGYETTSNQVQAWPMSSLLVAVGVGIGIGWALRGSADAAERQSFLDQIRSQRRSYRW